MIEGLVQGVKYESASHRLFFHLRHDGEDVTTFDAGTAKITIYNPDGEEILAATALTQVGSTAVVYYDLDASDSDTYELGFGYRAYLTWDVSSISYEDNILFDVVRWPFNEPLVTTEEIDSIKPGWSGKKPGGWTDWTVAIEQAHVKLQQDLRSMRDDQGEAVYAHRVLDRTQLRQAELAYVFAEIAVSGIRLSEAEQESYLRAAQLDLPTLLYLDRNDDLIMDDGEEAALGVRLVH